MTRRMSRRKISSSRRKMGRIKRAEKRKIEEQEEQWEMVRSFLHQPSGQEATVAWHAKHRPNIASVRT